MNGEIARCRNCIAPPGYQAPQSSHRYPEIRVGHADDAARWPGVTAILFDAPIVAVDVRGGGPGTRETDLLDPARTVERIDAITLSGGSALGLDAAGGVQAYLRSIGRGFAIGSARVPLVPAAIMFDLLNGGDKAWDRYPPYRELGYAAAESAAAEFALGSVGAGLGATTVNFKGGIGAASHVLDNEITVGALAVVNAVGSVVVGDGPWYWAAPFERNNEFGGHGFPAHGAGRALEPRTKGACGSVRRSSWSQPTRRSRRRRPGISRSWLRMAWHSPFIRSIRRLTVTWSSRPRPVNATDTELPFALAAIGNAAAQTVARAIARAIYEAAPLALEGPMPGYRNRYR